MFPNMIALFAIFVGLIGVGTDGYLGAGLGLELGAGLGVELGAGLGVELGAGLGLGTGLGLGAGLDVELGGGSDFDIDFDAGAEIGGIVGPGSAIGAQGYGTQILYDGSGVDLNLAADGITRFVGPYCSDFYRGVGCANLCNWPYCRNGGLPIGSLGVVGTNLPYVGYNGYGRTDYTRENFVRGNVFGSTEFGIRNEITVRPGYPNYPYPYPYPCIGFPRCLPQPYPVDIPRPVYPYAPGLVTAGDVQRVGLPDFQYR